jgi:diguanylate cyclase (GGDEF)-like protein
LRGVSAHSERPTGGTSPRFSVLRRWVTFRKTLSARLGVGPRLASAFAALGLLAVTAKFVTVQSPFVAVAWAATLGASVLTLRSVVARYNAMAAKLRAAHTVTREYQTELEVRVDERTRQLQHLAEHDPLTGLPNRRQLWTYLEAAIKSAPQDAQVAVFFLDLDNFKNINDSMGHAFGDLVLQGIAHRLREATGGPGGFASRLGGDEFTVVYGTTGGLADISRVGTELVSAFQRPMLIESRELLVSISVGASVYPDHAQTPDALLRAADAALFSAKTSGRSRLGMFNREMLETASQKFQIEQGLRRAVDRGEFELVFQPEVSFDSLGTTLVEALLRWRLPDGKYVSPGEFLPVAEESGLITSINDWVLRTAIQYGAMWHRAEWPNARVAINVSARQLLDTHFVDRMRELLAENDLPPRCIEIELTETVLQTGPSTIETLRELRQLGVSIALDDFGTGYSSLASLEKLPLTRVKLDRSLIASIDISERSLAIARAIIGLCENLHLEVTAEGIERQQQLALLLGYRSMSLQGFLIAHPMHVDRVPESVAQMPARLESFLLAASSPAIPGAAIEAPMPVRATG